MTEGKLCCAIALRIYLNLCHNAAPFSASCESHV